MSNRKPYIREVKRTWWKSNPFYRFYMVREATVLPLIVFTLSTYCYYDVSDVTKCYFL